jgi:uncharacterized protein
MSFLRRLTSTNLGQLFIEIVAVIIPVLIVNTLLNLLPAPFLQSTIGDILLNVLIAAVIVVVFVTAVHRLEHRSLDDAGLPSHPWVRPLVLGDLFGGVLMSIVIIVMAVAGFYHITGIQPFVAVELAFFLFALGLLALLFARKNVKIGFFHYVLFVLLAFGLFTTSPSLLILVAGAVQEELVFRGIIFRLLERSLGSWIALLINILLFGVIHLLNPNATIVSALAIMVTGGVIITATYILTRSLWWAIAVHLGWNFFEGPIFGTQLSGHTMPGYFSSVTTGPVAWTGGSFGPEAGLVSILLIGAVGVFLCYLAYHQHRIIPNPRRQQSTQNTIETPTL